MSTKHTSNIRWRNSDIKKITNVVRQFNAKRTRIINSNPSAQNYLPQKVNVTELRANIQTRKDFNRIIKSLSRFKQKGSETPVENSNGLVLTKYELNELRIKVRSINIRRAYQRKLADVSIYKGNTGTIAETNLQPKKFNFDKLNHNTWTKFNQNVEKQLQTNYFNDRAYEYKQNYIKALYTMFNSEADYAVELVNKIDGNVLAQAYYDNTILQLDFIYDPLELQFKLDAIIENLEKLIPINGEDT